MEAHQQVRYGADLGPVQSREAASVSNEACRQGTPADIRANTRVPGAQGVLWRIVRALSSMRNYLFGCEREFIVHKREGFIERVLHRIERYIEEADERMRTREEEFEHYRETLWAEAAERERLLVRAVSEKEARERSLEEVGKEHRVTFVVHSEEAGRALKELADGGARLVSVVPGSGSFENSTGIKGSWLVFQ
jgi:hypothetical protein